MVFEMCKTIKQTVKFKTSPQAIYDELVRPSWRVGRPFTSFGGVARGIVVDLKKGCRIVQAWRSRKFPPGIYSMAAITLVPRKNGGTELTLIHRGVPARLIPEVENMWRRRIWNKLKK